MDLDGPGLEPPPNVVPNLINPPNGNDIAWAVIGVCVAVSTLCLIVRGYARVFLLKKVQAEEFMIVAAYGIFWGAIYSLIALIDTPGFFVHQWNVPLRNLIPTTYWIFIFGVAYSVVLPLLKVSILVEWCRVFVPRGNRAKSPFLWGCVVVMFVQIAGGIAIIIAMNLQCTPHAGIWDFTILDRVCMDLYPIQVASATIHLVSDVAILVLPQRVIWTLKMSWRKRLGVAIIFGLGLFACFSAAFRMYATVSFGRSPDATYNMGPLGFWATAEMTVGFFITCVPCLPKILRETGVIRNIKRRLGMTTATKGTGKLDYYGAGESSRGGLTSTNKDPYYKLQEEGVAMDALHKTGDSTERLHEGQIPHGVIRTTRITVTQDARTNDNKAAGPHSKFHHAWDT